MIYFVPDTIGNHFVYSFAVDGVSMGNAVNTSANQDILGHSHRLYWGNNILQVKL